MRSFDDDIMEMVIRIIHRPDTNCFFPEFMLFLSETNQDIKGVHP